NGFTWVSGSGLYVNVGGDPSQHSVDVGARPYGVYVSGRSWVNVLGFHIVHCENRGIVVTNASANVVVKGNTVDGSFSHGIHIDGSTAVDVAQNVCSNNANHGIAVIGLTTNSVIEQNECMNNALPTTRAANGIYLDNSPNNVV